MLDPGRLLARVADGDKRAFEILFAVYQARFLAVAESITGDLAGAEDAVQEAFVRILRFAADADSRRDPSAWLFRICVNCAKDDLARRRTRLAREAPREGSDRTQDLATPLSEVIRQEERGIVTEEIRSLPPDLRAVLMLRFTADLKYDQIADVLGVPLGTVQSRLHSAVEKLREAVSRRISADVR